MYQTSQQVESWNPSLQILFIYYLSFLPHTSLSVTTPQHSTARHNPQTNCLFLTTFFTKPSLVPSFDILCVTNFLFTFHFGVSPLPCHKSIWKLWFQRAPADPQIGKSLASPSPTIKPRIARKIDRSLRRSRFGSRGMKNTTGGTATLYTSAKNPPRETQTPFPIPPTWTLTLAPIPILSDFLWISSPRHRSLACLSLRNLPSLTPRTAATTTPGCSQNGAPPLGSRCRRWKNLRRRRFLAWEGSDPNAIEIAGWEIPEGPPPMTPPPPLQKRSRFEPEENPVSSKAFVLFSVLAARQRWIRKPVLLWRESTSRKRGIA